ncbi:hypothetical protein [Clostridium sp. MD294]|uniref:hypothetical protein n=1 Tax=Clostridium sp. MD294 TaxID=97138 RepID=UPI0002C967F6|nr:hypothetical protein [Clostridium sp. MD294]NDO45408.1 hypothetical protein [Clostridium sp. MD294]USF30947.1 hypothetical protein C820_002391 [Clostridium sp. MD294]
MKKLLKFVLFLCCIIMINTISYAKTAKVIYSDITAYINGLPIPSYNLNDNTVVIAKDLEQYGFDLNYVDEERCLYIDYNPNKEVTADYKIEKENKKIGSVAFTAQATDIFIKVKGFNISYDTSYSIDGQILVSIDGIDGLEHSYGEYITWDWEKRTISFDYVKNWEILPRIDYAQEKSKNISSFMIELNKIKQNELYECENEKQEFYAKGENEQYLSSFKIAWREKMTVKDLTKSRFGNGKITINFCIYKTLETEQLIKLLNSILTINVEEDVATKNIITANEHIKVFINGKSVPISAIELEQSFNDYVYYIELDKEIKNLEEIQSIKIECK